MARDPSIGSPVVDGEIRYLSVSAIDKADPKADGGCLRKWFYKYVEKRPEPTSKSQAIGTKLHEEIEHYLKTGEKTLGRLALSGADYIPEPGAGLLVEHSIKGLDIIGIPIVGYIDVVNTRRLASEGIVEVRDWKTSGDVERHAKTGEQLLSTTQMVGYGEWARRTYPAAEIIQLTHTYFQTRGAPRAEERTHFAHASHFAPRWELRGVIARSIVDAAKETDAAKVEANYKACKAFGGCAYKSVCPRSPAVSLHDHLEGNMDLMDFLGEKKTAPPDAPKLEDLKPAEKAEPIPADIVASFSPAVQEAAKDYVTAPPAPTEEKPKKTRAKKTASADPAAKDPGPARPRVFINCLPDYEVAHLDDYVRAVSTTLAEKYGVRDVRCAPNDVPELSFGKWEGQLQLLVKSCPPPSGDYYFDTRGSKLREVVAEALRDVASCVRGIG